MAISRHAITAIILAGGRARRMGGVDKGLLELNGSALIEHLLRAITPQVSKILINANRNIDLYREFGHPVIQDRMDDYPGPLAGFSSAMSAAATPYILTLPCDAPLLPDDFVRRMCLGMEAEKAQIAAAHDGTRLHSIHALIERSLGSDLDAYLASGERKIDRWYQRHRLTLVDFSDCPKAFRNVNTLEERDKLEKEGKAA